MLNIIQRAFPKGQYIEEETQKTQIVLHHTVSSNVDSPINYWASTKDRVAVSFIIGKDGSVYQIFDDKYWAYHLGAGTNSADNKRSIGIEIVNEGPVHMVNGKWMWLDKKASYNGDVFHCDKPFRGYNDFAAYTTEQRIAAAELCAHLCMKHDIPRDLITHLQYDKSLLSHKGIIAHHNVRPDKSDVHPGFDFETFKKVLGL